jgi:hypothetical protein
MINLLGEGTVVGYCTNVHAGASWEEARSNLERHAVAVKRRVYPDAPMGIGLWLSANTVTGILEKGGIPELAGFLDSLGLSVFTLNGFPYGDFHQPVVKHKVYEPDWGDEKRFEYTLHLVSILSELVPDMGEGSISTLPVGWGKAATTQTDIDKAVSQFVRLSEHLQENEIETGKLVHVDLEPEPGCYLDRCGDVVDFFKERLFREGSEEIVHRYLRVCHDVCHSAVMFEGQRDILERYQSAGIQIGKAQISSAIKVNFAGMNDEDRERALEQLRSFQEDRYLHQTFVRDPEGGKQFFEDLPLALDSIAGEEKPTGEWRVHFHVPIFLESAGAIGTTQDQIMEGLPLLMGSGVKHYEVETYAWNVLPESLREENLADGIARELEWLKAQVEW